jgi:hypothetical protein
LGDDQNKPAQVWNDLPTHYRGVEGGQVAEVGINNDILAEPRPCSSGWGRS